MKIQRLDRVPKAPLTGGPYVQAVIHEQTIYIAGQIPWDCGHQKLFSGSVTEETENIFENLKVILHACGSSLDQVLRVTAFLASADLAKEFSAAYENAFKPDCLPVRTMVMVAGLPLGARIEVELTAGLADTKTP